MNTTPNPVTRDEARNADPLSGESGAHPVATGIGAAAVGAAGLAAAAIVAGPVGVIAAAVGGALIGAYAGKAAGELIDPTAEEAFWREEHPRQPFAKGEDYRDYGAAYQVGYEGYPLYGKDGRTFDDAEQDLRASYEARGVTIPWERARDGARVAWDRVHRRATGPADPTPIADTVTSENLQSGALSNAQMPR